MSKNPLKRKKSDKSRAEPHLIAKWTDSDQSRAEPYLIAKWIDKCAHRIRGINLAKRSLSPAGRFLVHQYYKKRPIVHDLIYKQKMQLDHLSRSEFDTHLNHILGSLHFLDERFVLFMKLDEKDRKPIVTLAELQLEKQEIYDWDSMKIDQRVDLNCEIVVRCEDPMENVVIMEAEDHEIFFDLKLKNTTKGPRICKSSLKSGHQIFRCLEYRMLDGKKIYGFTKTSKDIKMTEILSYDFETKESEIIKLEGLTKIGAKYEHNEEEYYLISAGCWIERRFFGVFAPKNLNSLFENNHVIFCMDLDTRKWQSTSFAFNNRIRQLSVAQDQLIVEAEDGNQYLSIINGPPNVMINCYRLSIKCPTSLQQIAFDENSRYLRKKPKLAEKFKEFLLPKEFRKIESPFCTEFL